MGVVHLARRGDGRRGSRSRCCGRTSSATTRPGAGWPARSASLSRVTSRWVAEIVDADPWAPDPVRRHPLRARALAARPRARGGADHGHRPDLVRRAASPRASRRVHAVGVLHRDVKPSNVLMEGRTPILIDFGLARVADDPKLTHTGWLLGTPGYLAPEILLRRGRDRRLRRALVGGHRRVRRRPAGRRSAAGRRWRSWTGSAAASTTSPGIPDAAAPAARRGARPRARSGGRRSPRSWAGCRPQVAPAARRRRPRRRPRTS